MVSNVLLEDVHVISPPWHDQRYIVEREDGIGAALADFGLVQDLVQESLLEGGFVVEGVRLFLLLVGVGLHGFLFVMLLLNLRNDGKECITYQKLVGLGGRHVEADFTEVVIA